MNAVQAVDWSDFFAKILTQIAAGTAPDLVYVATEGVQLFAQRLGVPAGPLGAAGRGRAA